MEGTVAGTGLTAEQLRVAANSPEVHAAAILAAKEYVLSLADRISGNPNSDSLMQTISLHAAIIMRSYLYLIADANLGESLERAKPAPSK